MSDQTLEPKPATRQWLSERRGATVEALLDAAIGLVREVGYDALTVRTVAGRAGMTHTTAYAYFTSKDHLVAEAFWRLLSSLPHPDADQRGSLADRVDAALAGPALALVDEPELAHAALRALLADDAEVGRIRDAVGADQFDRLTTALGPDADPAVVEALMLAFSGAMLQAGMGYFDFGGVVERMATVAGALEAA